MKKDKNPYSSACLYQFNPQNDINSELIEELTNVIQIGVGGHVLEKMSPELQKHFKEIKQPKKVA